MNSKEFKIYKHISPSNKVYIGLTSLELSNRFRNGLGYKNNKYFSKAIEKYGWENFSTEVLDIVSSYEEAEEKEIQYILHYNSNNKKFGYNIELGGSKGSLGLKRSKETLIRMSESQIGKTIPKKVRNKISNTLKGRIFTKEHSLKKSLSQLGERNHRYGIKTSKETRDKMSASQKKGVDNKFSKKVVQKTLEGIIVKIWDCISLTEREGDFRRTDVIACCKGRQKTHRNYIWEYYD